jgi:hypothetical protein
MASAEILDAADTALRLGQFFGAVPGGLQMPLSMQPWNGLTDSITAGYWSLLATYT